MLDRFAGLRIPDKGAHSHASAWNAGGRDHDRHGTCDPRAGVGDPARIAGQIAARKADAAIVYATSLGAKAKRKLRVITIPARARPRIALQIAVVTGAPHRKAASAFIRRVRSRAGRAALRRAGFKTP
ncbi:MAG: Bacterial extracellular solute-binding protein [Solirubrobacteraceae bacterium]|nr:Bacterial extracellular solute-binding protein [Solirubrobacteraceae bacterium]